MREKTRSIMFLLCLGATTVSAGPSVADLDWLSGDWGGEVDGRWTEESWLPPRGGLMVGLNRTGDAARASGFDLMRIEAGEDGTLVYWGAPGGAAPTPFRLTAHSARRVVFENPAHDYPTRIVYARSGNTLTATISGGPGSRPMSWTWRPVVRACQARTD